jgi:hypothetical protein
VPSASRPPLLRSSSFWCSEMTSDVVTEVAA